MDAVHRLNPAIEFDVYTKVPRWFFMDSLSGPWTYHSLLSDIGFAQKTPLEIDLAETVSRLDRFYPSEPSMVQGLAHKLSRRKCALVVCDIAPLGIEAAQASGIPSVLVENFTWDWLYEAYKGVKPRISRHVRHLRGLFGAADFHVQTEPVCRRMNADLVTGPISRSTRMTPSDVRKKLGISSREKVVLLTMGGIRGSFPSLKVLQSLDSIRFLIPGTARTPHRKGNLILLPHQSEYFHPDLVEASDVVIGKIGYSTLAETYGSGVPFGYIVRKDFRESDVLVAFAKARMESMPVTEEEFINGEWVSLLPALLALPRTTRTEAEGSENVAMFLMKCLERSM
jgi:hypothetical protein